MLRRNRNYNNPINENNEENVAVAKENPLVRLIIFQIFFII